MLVPQRHKCTDVSQSFPFPLPPTQPEVPQERPQAAAPLAAAERVTLLNAISTATTSDL